MSVLTVIPCRAADGATSTLRAGSAGNLAAGSPLMLATPAMGLEGSFYEPLAIPFADAGLRLVTMDLRGHGTSSVRAGRGSDFGYRELLELDWPAAIAVCRTAYPDAPVVLLGHSLGGQVSVLFAGANPDSVAAVVTVATGSIWWRAFPPPRRYGFLLATQFIAATGRLLGSYPGHRIGFGGHEASRLVRDWAYPARTGRYRAEGSDIDYEDTLSDTACPVLLITVAGDDFAPPSAADHLAGKLPADRATRRHLDHAVFARSRNAHFGWVKHGGTIAETVAPWLAEHHIAGSSG
ncbi:MAG: alpha/beta fold hydrolase [Xanthomonadales bacterium]